MKQKAQAEAIVDLKFIDGKWRAVGYELREPCSCGGYFKVSIEPARDDQMNMKYVIKGISNMLVVCDACGLRERSRVIN